MSKISRIVVLCVALLITMVAQAQNLRNNPRLQERITQAKLSEIQRGLNLNDDEMKKFAPVYKRYESELNKLNTAEQGKLLRTSPDSITAELADQIINTRLDNAIMIGTIRKKYYPEFRTVLTPQQVMKLYQSEAKLRRKVMAEFRRRFGDRDR